MSAWKLLASDTELQEMDCRALEKELPAKKSLINNMQRALELYQKKEDKKVFEWTEACSWKEARELLELKPIKEAEEVQELIDKQIEAEDIRISKVLGRRLDRDPELVTKALGLVLGDYGYQVSVKPILKNEIEDF